MHKSMTFNNIRKPWLYLLEGRKKSPFAPVRNNLIKATGMPGAYVTSKEIDVIQIEQPIGFVVKDDEHEVRIIDELSSWLSTTEAVPLEFDDEPGRIYYAEIEGSIEDYTKFSKQRSGVITFVCANPYSYSKEEKTITIDGPTLINNEGNEPADPIIELTATKKATFAMVSIPNVEGDAYNLLGIPADDDVKVVDEKEKIYEIDGLNGWSSGGVVSDSRFPEIDGTMQYDEVGFRVSNYGNGEGIHGPALIRELDVTTQDFEVDAIFDVISEREIEAWRIEIKLLDEGMNEIGIIGVKDNNAYKKLRVGLGRFGEYRGNGKSNGYLIGDDNYSREFGNNASIQMRFTRKGNEISIQAGRRYINHLYNVEKERYIDTNDSYQGRLKYIQIMIGTYGSRVRPSRLRINKLDVYKLNKVERDETPYIIYEGDKVTFDHKLEELLINGEDAMMLKDFGAEFFKLPKGYSTLEINPPDTFTGEVRLREKYK